MHMIDPFQERQRGQQREPKWREMMQQLEVEVVGIGGWELVQSVKVEGKNAEAEFEDVRVFQWVIHDILSGLSHRCSTKLVQDALLHARSMYILRH